MMLSNFMSLCCLKILLIEGVDDKSRKKKRENRKKKKTFKMLLVNILILEYFTFIDYETGS